MSLTADAILQLERDSIEKFVLSCRESFHGRVLDYGAGKMPYRQIVLDQGADYVPHDRAAYPANVSDGDIGMEFPLDLKHEWDAILCNQVIQYVPEPFELLRDFRYALKPGGSLVLTGPTNWRVIEDADLWRFTRNGANIMLEEAGFTVERIEWRASIGLMPGFDLPLGWGALAAA